MVGPTGVAWAEGTLYVSDTAGNRLAAIPDALFRNVAVKGGGVTVAKGGFLNGPLGLAMAPNGDILTANADDGNIVEPPPQAPSSSRRNGSGRRWPVRADGGAEPAGVYFVNDSNNTLDVLH